MCRSIVALAVLLVACGQPSNPAATAQAPGAAPAQTAASEPPWFFCDGIDAPVIYLFGDSPTDGRVRFVEYDKRSGASVRTLDLQTGESEGAAGSVYTPLTRDGAEFGHVRQTNPGMMETPSAAYTLPYSSVQIEGRDVRCRWMPRTRVAAFTGRRSFVINEDADGDLIYTTYDFARAANAPEIQLSENGQSTAFSVEVRNGQENVTPNGADFTFLSRDGYTYHVRISNDQAGSLEVLRGGARVQSEPLIAFIQGQAEAD